MNLLLTRPQVEELDYKQCQQALKDLNIAYDLDRPLKECFAEVWPILDEITNTLCFLEDRISQYENVNYSTLQIETD